MPIMRGDVFPVRMEENDEGHVSSKKTDKNRIIKLQKKHLRVFVVSFLDSLGFLCVNCLSRIHLFQALPGITLPFTLVLWLSGSGTQIGGTVQGMNRDDMMIKLFTNLDVTFGSFRLQIC